MRVKHFSIIFCTISHITTVREVEIQVALNVQLLSKQMGRDQDQCCEHGLRKDEIGDQASNH
jgi:hypothetical protein